MLFENVEENMIRFIGRDMSGINRVFGEGATEQEAADQCEKAIYEYVKRRPDCWPMTMHRDTGEEQKRKKQMSAVNKAMSAAFFGK